MNTTELDSLFSAEDLASAIVLKWDTWTDQRDPMMSELKEQRNFVFATDTAHTVKESGDSPWNNKTTLPKICQIRDNLHANYMAALFPNDDWMRWEGYSKDDDTREKREAIQAYMSNKVRESNFRNTVSKLVYDYIDTGNVFADCTWVNEKKEIDGEVIPGYVGPKALRRSIMDIAFDPTATEFASAGKITRSVVRIGELKLLAKSNPQEWIQGAIDHADAVRAKYGMYTQDDVDKAAGFSVDGFGDLYEYYGSGYVELLEFEGTIHDIESGELLEDYIVTVIDKTKVVRKQKIPAWKCGGYKVHTGWRKRPDNLYAMGPLANLVGMQYRIDHLENAKDDAWDLLITPMWKIKGGVEEFEFYPGGEVRCDEDGDVEPLTKPTEALAANNEIQYLMELMEQFAGAPREAMGVRSPGEKTAFEVQALENAAGRIFQEKITQFEIEILEPLLNNMLETAVRNMNGVDVVRVMDDDLGVAAFLSISKEDITAKGKLRPIGARHFAQRAQMIQNLTGVANSSIWPKIERHVSDINLAKMIEDSLQIQRFGLVTDNAAMFERAESEKLSNQLQEDVQVQAATPAEDESLG